jgi:hypothetical protein
VSFYKKQLRLVCNKTQAEALATITGTDDYSQWIGHQVVLSEGTAPTGQPTIIISPIPDPPPAQPPINGSAAPQAAPPLGAASTAEASGDPLASAATADTNPFDDLPQEIPIT